jgi:hypothetical protein
VCNPTWLRFDVTAAGIPDASDADRLYANSHTGLIGGLGMAARLAQRSTFDRRLGPYMPVPTHVLYSGGLTTESAYDLVRGALLDRTPLGAGDGTVPVFSAMADGCQLGAAGTRTRLPALEHKAIPVDRRVTAAVMAIVLRTAAPAPAPEVEVPPLAVAA